MKLPSAAATATSAFRIRPAIILFGDSLTQQGWGGLSLDGSSTYQVGWASLLAAAYTRRVDVLNRGFSGYNTNHCLELLPSVWGNDNNDTDFLFGTVWLGANDAAIPSEPQHVPLDTYTSNLKAIISGIRQRTNSSSSSGDESGNAGSFPIIVLSPPPVHEQTWNDFLGTDEPNRTNERAKAYGDRAKQVAHEMNCEFLDTWELLQGNDTKSLKDYLSDGLHLNGKGNTIVYRGIMSLIEQKCPDLFPMSDDDGEGRYGKKGGLPMEEALWRELCGLPVTS